MGFGREWELECVGGCGVLKCRTGPAACCVRVEGKGTLLGLLWAMARAKRRGRIACPTPCLRAFCQECAGLGSQRGEGSAARPCGAGLALARSIDRWLAGWVGGSAGVRELELDTGPCSKEWVPKLHTKGDNVRVWEWGNRSAGGDCRQPWRLGDVFGQRKESPGATGRRWVRSPGRGGSMTREVDGQEEPGPIAPAGRVTAVRVSTDGVHAMLCGSGGSRSW